MVNNRINIVLVEDNATDAMLIRKMLASASEEAFEVNQVSTISAAVNLLSEHPCDLVLLDLSLPDGEGLNNIVALKKVRRRIPILVLTANNDYYFSINAIQNGAHDYLVKGSFNSVLLGRAIRYAVERSKQENELNQYLKKVEHLNTLLHKLNEDKNEFMAIASHDMKNPLGVIYSLSESMLKEIDTIGKEELAELLSIIN
ncbi:MAG: response regulator, partial [Ignavibacteriaceae bacterium]|nr:response regulator [Ignavibacteriaceae bacterium]